MKKQKRDIMGDSLKCMAQVREFNSVSNTPKTVKEFIKENNLQFGDKVTNGFLTWRIDPDFNENICLVSDFLDCYISNRLSEIISIPKLKVLDERIKVYKWVFKDPRDSNDFCITPYWHENKKAVEKDHPSIADSICCHIPDSVMIVCRRKDALFYCEEDKIDDIECKEDEIDDMICRM